MIKLKFKKLSENAYTPVRAHKGDLWDIKASETVNLNEYPKFVSTGLAFEIPEGYQIRIYNRSGNAKKGVILANSVGIIDTLYRGEVKALFYSVYGDYIIHKGDKILQMELVRINDIEFEETDELSDTERGTGGFGSTGK